MPPLQVILSPGIGVREPSEPVTGRFQLHGVVVDTEQEITIDLTHEELHGLVNSGASKLLWHPRCGITPGAD